MPSSIFHTINPKDIWLGDHLYIWRIGFYQHHGIVLFVDKDNYDDSIIMEFNTEDGSHKPWLARIQTVTLKTFRGSSTLKRVVYGSRYGRFKLAGTAYSFQSLAPEIVVDNAQLILEQIRFGGDLIIPNDPTTSSASYHLILRNCECLAFWCKTGKWYSEQIEKMVHWISSALVTFLKSIASYLFTKQSLVGITQEIISEIVEPSVDLIKDKFYSIFMAEGIGNAISVVIIELIKLVFRYYQYNHGQMSCEEFWKKTLENLITGLTTGVFSLAIQVLLTAITLGAAAPLCPIIGLIGSVIGAIAGNSLSRLLIGGRVQLQNEWLQDNQTYITQ